MRCGRTNGCYAVRSGSQSHGFMKCLLLKGCTRTKPCRVKTVIRASRSAMLIDKLRHAVQQSPGRARGRRHVATLAFAREQRVDVLDRLGVGLLI